MKHALFAIVEAETVEWLVLELKQAKFSDLQISILTPEVDTPKNLDLLPDATRGVLTGGVIGVIAAEAVSFTIPGIGPFLAAGPIVAALAGGAIGSVVGGLSAATGWISSILGVPHSVVKDFERDLSEGRALVMVDCSTPEATQRARQAFARIGVQAVHETGSVVSK